MNDLNREEWAALYQRLESGAATYEDAAAMWGNTLIGQSSGVSPEEFVVRLKAKYPTPESLAAILQQLVGMVPEQYRPKTGRSH